MLNNGEMSTSPNTRPAGPSDIAPGSAVEVLRVFTVLGCTSFGGPTAHLGYFRQEFVERRRWLSDTDYADLVALCQFLPGPASSQVGMALGWRRAGFAGMCAAFIGFTLPSVIVLSIFAAGVLAAGDLSNAGWIMGLKAAAVAVVAHAVLGMARSLLPDAVRASIAVAVMALLLLVPGVWTQVTAIVVAGLAGYLLLRAPQEQAPPDRSVAEAGSAAGGAAAGAGGAAAGAGGAAEAPRALSSGGLWLSAGAFATFVALLVALPVLAATTGNSALALADMFYRAGALVFGGGHVVLPLLEAETMRLELMDTSTFLAGYGAAQAVPGPLFTFASYLGFVSQVPPGGVVGALVATAAIFLPAMLLVIAATGVWERLRHIAWLRRALMGVNAAVVGILAAALYDPVWTSAVTGPVTVVFVVVSYLLLSSWKIPAWAVVILAALAGWAVL